MTTKLNQERKSVSTGCLIALLFFCLTINGQEASEHKAYQLISYAENTNSVEEVIDYCEQAIATIDNSLEANTQFDIYQKVALTLYNHKQYGVSKKYFGEALKLKSKINDINLIADIEGYLGWIESANNHYEQAIVHFNAALKLYAQSKNLEKTGNTYNSIGAMHWYQRNYPLALDNFDKVLSIGERMDNSTLIRKGLTNKGVVLNTLSQYNEALACFESALEIAQLDNDKKSRAALLNNIGNLNSELKQNETALHNFKEALQLYIDLDDKDGISGCYNNMGEVYLQLGNTLQALENYQTSLAISKQEGDSASITISYVNIGRAHQNGQQYSKAISYYEKALKLMLTFDDPSLKAETYLHLGQTLLINRHYDQSKSYLEKACQLANTLEEKSLQAQACNSLSEWYSKQGDYEKALSYKSEYAELKDAITDEQAMLSSARMEAVYKLLQKEEQISILEQDNIDKTESLQLARNTRTVYLIIAGMLLVILIVLFVSFRARKKAEHLLKEKNEELKQLNATKDKFFSIIAHDLKSPFSSLMGFAEMLALNAESKNTSAVVEYSQIIHNSTKRLLGLVENLLQWSRTQIGTTEYKPSQLDISIQTHNIVSLLRLNAEEKDIVISPKIERNLIAWADENLYNTTLRNLISNAIKFSRIGSVIYVTAGIKNDMIEVSVADSGVGIRQENLEKLFTVDTTFSTKGTLNEKGTGLGLVLCKEFVEINKGTIWAESELEKGSTFYFTLPLLHNN
ncbi:tetratricopeptide repeat-containing sensor histidine kinase [Carboxylicivirga sp. A043]|uniref:tetratricopeptide repeat-containing sensor histidine kinase n=1 Tax=Carboxylicivirga litoralis TaxID=2816963 RepID=UPI0021CB2B93|nr:tetratricopeptide repeat-containing sensor histidine kinase [Carboxylicivirga sp. A043]MCU4155392.1 tetratricopeptide repeat-containing sensor histidine kinase [Carboxylicivirga sp. A043]